MCTFHVVSLKPHDRYIMGDIFAYDKYQVKSGQIRPAPGLDPSW